MNSVVDPVWPDGRILDLVEAPVDHSDQPQWFSIDIGDRVIEVPPHSALFIFTDLENKSIVT